MPPKNMKSTGLRNIYEFLVTLEHAAYFGPRLSLAGMLIEKRSFSVYLDGLFHREVLLQGMNAFRINVGYPGSAAFALSNSDGQAFQIEIFIIEAR